MSANEQIFFAFGVMCAISGARAYYLYAQWRVRRSRECSSCNRFPGICGLCKSSVYFHESDCRNAQE